MTATAVTTLQTALNNAHLAQISDILAKVRLGTMLTPLKRTFSSLTSATTQDLTLIDGTGETTGVNNPKRLAALSVTTLRVTAGTLATGPAIITDAGGTAAAIGATNNHVVLLSDDGKVLTFQAAVTGFVIEYIPRPFTDMTAAQAALDGAP